MANKLSASVISLKEFNSVLQRYEEHVLPKLQELDKFRFEILPQRLAERKAKDGPAMNLDEATRLVEWKLKHGTFRPTLLKLVQSNSEDTMHNVTAKAFTEYTSEPGNLNTHMKTLITLKGIGPATAALFLSVFDPVAVPFFSDELLWYLHWDEPNSEGWNRKIGYTLKEYLSLHEKCQIMRERLKEESGEEISALDIEKVAYVLGKEAIDLDDPVKTEEAVETEGKQRGTKRGKADPEAAEEETKSIKRKKK
ncbi:hypothetical protein K402DRAFT_329288 [Aulographum hederae CBS 113979]|uniref:Uncharacterized protein n=1 Tax=Aulographum hederae CBS 113979 TaxID=1176131 RepID=A0A6G1H4C8_9PEZI|nr:hypothetical protein K402DRAFT_329288 [Aulographum hederae CBS 113979]